MEGALLVAVDGGLDSESFEGVALLGSADCVDGIDEVGSLVEGGALWVAVEGDVDARSVGGLVLLLHAASRTARTRVGPTTRGGLTGHVLSSWA